MIIVLKSTKTWTFSWKSCMSFSSKQPKHKHFYEKVTWNYHQINKIMIFFMKKLHDNCPQINKIMNFFMKKFHDIVLKSTKTWTFYEKIAWYLIDWKSLLKCVDVWVCALWLTTIRSKTASSLDYASFGLPQIAPKLRQCLSVRVLVDRKSLFLCTQVFLDPEITSEVVTLEYGLQNSSSSESYYRYYMGPRSALNSISVTMINCTC